MFALPSFMVWDAGSSKPEKENDGSANRQSKDVSTDASSKDRRNRDYTSRAMEPPVDSSDNVLGASVGQYFNFNWSTNDPPPPEAENEVPTKFETVDSGISRNEARALDSIMESPSSHASTYAFKVHSEDASDVEGLEIEAVMFESKASKQVKFSEDAANHLRKELALYMKKQKKKGGKKSKKEKRLELKRYLKKSLKAYLAEKEAKRRNEEQKNLEKTVGAMINDAVFPKDEAKVEPNDPQVTKEATETCTNEAAKAGKKAKDATKAAKKANKKAKKDAVKEATKDAKKSKKKDRKRKSWLGKSKKKEKETEEKRDTPEEYPEDEVCGKLRDEKREDTEQAVTPSPPSLTVPDIVAEIGEEVLSYEDRPDTPIPSNLEVSEYVAAEVAKIQQAKTATARKEASDKPGPGKGGSSSHMESSQVRYAVVDKPGPGKGGSSSHMEESSQVRYAVDGNRDDYHPSKSSGVSVASSRASTRSKMSALESMIQSEYKRLEQITMGLEEEERRFREVSAAREAREKEERERYEASKQLVLEAAALRHAQVREEFEREEAARQAAKQAARQAARDRIAREVEARKAARQAAIDAERKGDIEHSYRRAMMEEQRDQVEQCDSRDSDRHNASFEADESVEMQLLADGTAQEEKQQDAPSFSDSPGNVISQKQEQLQNEISAELAKLQALQNDFIQKVQSAKGDGASTILRSDIFSKSVFHAGPLKSQKSLEQDLRIQDELFRLRNEQSALFAKGRNLAHREYRELANRGCDYY